MRPRYDVIVVGARCAGASVAGLLARAGMSVLALDRDPEGSDTLSTHGLMRGGVLQLQRWGVLERLIAAGTPPVRTTTFHYDRESIEVAIKPRDGVDALYAPRRTLLDAALVDAARGAGAEVVHRATVTGLLRHGGVVRGVTVTTDDGASHAVRADLVVGADGLRSRVARLAGAEVERRGDHACGVIYGYFEGLASNGFHWHYTPGVSVGVIPTNAGRTCVFAALPAARFRAELPRGLEALHRQVLLESSADLAAAASEARRVGRWFPFPGAPGHVRRSWGPGWALLGDAGFFRDPITAHGITDALRDAELLARAVVRGTARALADYQRERDQLAIPMLEISDRIASFAWDLEEAKVLHLELSRRMNAEVAMMRDWDRAGTSVCPVSYPFRHGTPGPSRTAEPDGPVAPFRFARACAIVRPRYEEAS